MELKPLYWVRWFRGRDKYYVLSLKWKSSLRIFCAVYLIWTISVNQKKQFKKRLFGGYLKEVGSTL